MDRIYASWNQTVPASTSKAIYEAWWRVLNDLTVVDVDAAVDTLIRRDGFMPRPGTIRRMVRLEDSAGLPPEPMDAWFQLRQMAENAHNGSYSPASLHECLRETIARLGGVSCLELHTNGDREQFLTAYRKVVTTWEDNILA